ncbi:hypothetical protein J3E68DRAFT_407319 [Trichoderma sp. SZMC 28012]
MDGMYYDLVMYVQAWRRLGDRCVVQIPPILRHLRPCQRERKRNQNGPVENIIFCLPDELAGPISNFYPTAASNTPRLVTFACPLAACLGLACPQPASHLSRCFTPTPSFHHKDAEPRPRRNSSMGHGHP